MARKCKEFAPQSKSSNQIYLRVRASEDPTSTLSKVRLYLGTDKAANCAGPEAATNHGTI